ncbi:MAG: 30S ribosomal protein THX [Saprospiraceae bacterium]|nr:30S ribosomal protein THX [Saprospiraceae bacterium]MDW8230095.1 30S ribosomal protein THX [Saprospiraceae bacterium]
MYIKKPPFACLWKRPTPFIFAPCFYQIILSKKMGKGDVKTKRGKIWRGSNGKSRPKPSKLRAAKKAAAQQ